MVIFSFSTLNISCHLLLTCKISAEKTADSLVGVSLQIVFSLAVFKILSLSLILTFSVQFICSVMSNSLRPHGLQHARPPCPLPAPRVYSNSCPSHLWCHLTHEMPTISSSVVPFSFCLQSFPASGSFPMSQCFASGGQSIGVSTSASVLPMNI